MKNLFKSNWFQIAFSILAALIIWIYVVYEINPVFETTIKNVPVNYVRYSEDFTNGKLTVLSENTKTVNVKIKGKRSTLSKVSRDSVYPVVNMSDVNIAGTHKIPISVTFDISGIELVSKEPHNVSVVVDKVVTRELNIAVDTKGTPADGYIYDSIEYTTDKVRITGAKSIIDKVEKAKVIVDIDGKLDPVKGRYKIGLFDKGGVEITDSAISKNISYLELTCNILRLREFDVIADLSDKTNSSGKKITVSEIKPAKLRVLGPRAVIEAMDALKTEEINVSGVRDGKTIKVKLSELPDKVELEDEETKEIEITFKVE